MKNLILASILALSTFSFSQNTFQGTAIYESKTDMKSFSFDSPDMNDEMKAKLLAKMSKAFEKTYLLNFNAFESTFQEEQKLQMQGTTVVENGETGISYKNLKEQIQLTEQESFNKNFLITEELKKWNWQLLDETKKIGDYSCLKARVIIPVSAEETAEYEKDKKQMEDTKTAFIQLIEPEAKTITVWYTTEIPIANGPSNYWGLPGLILEVNDGKTMLLCSKITLNPTDKKTIARPKKGKKISRKDFEKMEEEKLNAMKDEDGVIQLNVGGQ